MAAIRADRKNLIKVKITVRPDGTAINTVMSYLADKRYQPHDILQVGAGDTVAWRVELVEPGSRTALTPPFRVKLQNRRMFGVETISVPRGGTSAFLPVLDILDRSCTWKVTDITGKDFASPVQPRTIGSGFDAGVLSSGHAEQSGSAVPLIQPKYSIIWANISAPAVTVRDAAGKLVGDRIMTFSAGDQISIQAGGATNLAIRFGQNGETDVTWPSPFNKTDVELLVPANGLMDIKDDKDAGGRFCFVLKSDNASISSDICTMVMA